jgi:hypothetical protein
MNVAELLESGYDGLVHLRSCRRGGWGQYNVPVEDVVETYYRAIAEGFTFHGGIYFSAMAPTEKTVIQGEVIQTENGLVLSFSQLALPMREALSKGSFVCTGVKANWMLQYHLCPNSWEWVNVLLDRYHGHVIEFSTYSTEWGTLPGFNTVFWEVRNY